MNRTYLPVLGLIASLAGCTSPNPGDVELQQELDANRAKWTAAGLSAYEYRFSNGCFCPPEITAPLLIKVEANEVTDLRRADDNTPVEPRDGGFYPTIADLFDVLQSALESDAAAIVVQYDPDLGYPRDIYIDWNAGVADEETSLSATDLAAI
jgi:hypothetical protein